MSVKNAIVKAKIENAIVELMIKTNVDNVYLDETTTLASKLAEIVTAINEREKSADVDTKIQTAIDGLIGGAPATYDTLKEIADYLATHQNEYTALVQTVAGKVDKSVYNAFVATMGALATKDKVSEADLDTALATKITTAVSGSHSHANKAVLDGITAAKVSAWDGKPNVYIQTDQPTELKENDIWVQIAE